MRRSSASDREWTILRPGRLTDDQATGQARIDSDPFRGEVARADVAAVIAAVLPEPRSVGATLYVNGGDAADRGRTGPGATRLIRSARRSAGVCPRCAAIADAMPAVDGGDVESAHRRMTMRSRGSRACGLAVRDRGT